MTSPTPGLRERKKAETRRRLSAVATELFLARGFDAVSVAEVADAAGVSKMTVFNYFPRKEDLLLDRYPELVGLVTDALRGRPSGVSPAAAIHRLLCDLAGSGHPLGGPRAGHQRFLRTVRDSPALLARARELRDELTTVLAELITDAPEEAGHRAHLTATLIVAAYQAVYTTTAQRLLAGHPPSDLAADHTARLRDAYHAVERACAWS